MAERRGTKALELWCRRMTEGYPGVKIENMTTSWRDGLAFCAMIHRFRPDLIDFDKLNKDDVYYNNELAFTTAEKYLGIPALLDADDMAAYEVPDRLSILTYLSQFYQAFTAQDSTNRLKRNSAVVEKSQINKTASGPPPKMAHVVGVPKRETCQKCQLPVFLAERMAVGKKIYHRTCLKCARCCTQLTPGSFYETEVDDEYCCETCPDEEERSNSVLRNNEFEKDVEVRKSVRSSIAERLAFFEKSDQSTEGAAQKNVSDEEKTKSLQRLGESGVVSQSAFKMNTAFNEYLNDTVDGEKLELMIDDEDDDEKDENELEESEEESEGTSLNSTPSVILQNETKSMENEIVPKLPDTPSPAQRRFTATAQLKITLEQENLEKNNEQPLPQIKLTNIPYNLTDTENDTTISERHDKINNNGIDSSVSEELKDVSAMETLLLEKDEEKIVEEAKNKIDLIENFVTKDDNTNNQNVDQASVPIALEYATKKEDVDKMEIDKELREELHKLHSESSTDEDEIKAESGQNGEHALNATVEIRTKNDEDVATTERLSVVRARLQQFEENNNNDKGIDNEDTTSEKTLVAVEAMLPSTKTADHCEQNKQDEDEVTIVPSVNEVQFMQDDEEKEDTQVPEITQPKVPDNLNNNSTDYTDVEMRDKSDAKENGDKTESKKSAIEEYPEDLNPFKSDDEDEDKENVQVKQQKKNDNSNPFDSSDDEIELEKLSKNSRRPNSMAKVPPPRPPPPRISRNPFGDDGDGESNDASNLSRHSSLSSSLNKRTPVPTPRTNISQSSTPEPTPRINNKTHITISNNSTPVNNTFSPNSLQNTHDYYGSANSLSVHSTPQHMSRNSEIRGSCASLTSSTGGTVRSRKKCRAPLPPTQTTPTSNVIPKELFPSTETVNSSKSVSPSSSNLSSPKSGRKKRLAPPPPKPARLDVSLTRPIPENLETASKNSLSYPLQSESESKMCDEEKALLEGNKGLIKENITNTSKLRVIPLDASLLEDDEFVECNQSQSDDLKQQQLNAEHEEGAVVYRRLIQALPVSSPTHESNPLLDELNVTTHDRQLEKLKDNKEAQNRNRQSQLAGTEDLDNMMSNLMLGYSNKSTQGKWKRRKGPAPALPVPPRKVIQMLPLQEIRHELDIIEVQQQGLEKQGVILEQMIRDRCEGAENITMEKSGDGDVPKSQNTKEVEDLILQLFELVNEKNELFRRQAELMYLRRQHRLEQEQADLEYEIRLLMAQPERNKTDSDKSREESLIARLVEVVQLRNDVIECLEMDRLREAEEDWSIKTSLEEHNAKREKFVEAHKKTYLKLSKKEKKKQKEAKKLGKNSKRVDADKDADETELGEGHKLKKNKKRKFSFLGALV